MTSFLWDPDLENGWKLTFPNTEQYYELLQAAWNDYALQLAILYPLLIRATTALFRDGKLYARYKSSWKALMLVHNVALAVYSLATLVLSIRSLQSCSSDGIVNGVLFQRDHTLLFNCPNWATIAHFFWLSKYWEYLDTVFLIVAGKPVSFLQSFHHLGAGIVMWLITRSQNPAMWTFVVINSFIHTLMYTYYACAVRGVNLSAVKWILTAMQMTQMIFAGLIFPIWYPLHQGPGFRENPQIVLAHVVGSSYAAALLYLFGKFFIQSYVITDGKKKKNE
jgi:hypothetical protein